MTRYAPNPPSLHLKRNPRFHRPAYLPALPSDLHDPKTPFPFPPLQEGFVLDTCAQPGVGCPRCWGPVSIPGNVRKRSDVRGGRGSRAGKGTQSDGQSPACISFSAGDSFSFRALFATCSASRQHPFITTSAKSALVPLGVYPSFNKVVVLRLLSCSIISCRAISDSDSGVCFR
ncbi:hypothetical protein FIBSPDRAFT_302284 [Athelia psychrophila]|uniref:Uncharacterized protein n=1 Tax=Athelia psychrophila TaxID=1759441 RepID=A0A167X4M9_9AGAM|nr:hypothetical protein FIBSPDRAFT_302284 [Fibularhizoctonia sp. CBS 109695]